jgi:Flp pilus assembly protein TadG
MRKKNLNLEKGQSLVVTALLLVVFLGMLAWVIDGGYTFFMRRNAQNAADAGALAAADTYCETEDWALAEATGKQYAINENGSDPLATTVTQLDQDSNGILDKEDRLVRVDTSITFQTFFGRILDQAQITAPATATAGCFPPLNLASVMPVAWSCRKPVLEEPYPPPQPGEEPPPPHEWASEDCEYLYGDDLNPYLGQMYLIMDSDKIPEDLENSDACKDPPNNEDPAQENLLDCDINNDNINDIITGGDRAWLNLTRENVAVPQLRDWILGNERVGLETHVWLETLDGGKTDIYHAAATRIGQEFIIPVYNHLCDTQDAEHNPDHFNRLEPTKCYQDFTNLIEGGNPDEIYHKTSCSG